MVRRLLLLLAGLGGAALALVLWSGTAYASSPHTLDAPRIPGALAGALPQAGHRDPLPLPPLPAPPAPPVVRPVVDALPPVVAHTVTRLRDAVPPLAAIVPATQTRAHGAPSVAATAPGTTKRALTVHADRRARGFSGSAHVPVARSKSPTPVHTVHRRGADRLPLGVADGPGGTARTGSGAPYAVTRRDHRRTSDGWSHASLVVAREPEMVVLRDIARPG